MKLNKLFFSIFILFLITSCGGGGGGGGGTSPSTVALASIAVTPENPGILSDETQQFTATGTYSDSSTQDITTSVTWSSSSTAVATIGSASGLATAIAAGNTTIRASSGTISGSTTLTVTSQTITSIEITPVNPGIDLGATQQFTATGTYSDSSTKDITTTVTWSSSDTTTATISNTTGSKGLAASIAAGTTTITAGLDGVTSSNALLTVSSTTMDNVLPITLNGSLCSANSYVNKPCVSITVCEPGTSNCKTITDILLDTGSVGLRIFKSLLTDISLTQVASGSGSLANCIQYVDGSAHWGPVQIADVILGNEKAYNVPIHVIDSTFGTVPSSCGTPDAAPEDSGFNGILGAGLFTEDCGSTCANFETTMYYSCVDSTCDTTTVPLSNQVKNPVSYLSVDNNGLIVRLPSVATGGSTSADGVLILGIGTQSNNTVAGIAASYPTDSYGEFTTVFNSKTYNDSFMDSGSNGLFFNRSFVSALTICGDWYCPSSTQNLSASIEGYTISFKIGNASTLFASPNNVFSELGGTYESFDWGLPFFLGRNVYVVIEGNTISGLGTGPYLAY
ncbi:MAG: DUF3443 family protein [Smithella sp.]|jgi:hypothetical protein